MDTKRFILGFSWGIVATIAMSIPMIAGMITGIAPMPQPIPVAIMGKLFGGETTLPLIMISAIFSHLMYGGLGGAALSALTRHVTIWKGVLFGIALWFFMQVAVLPFLGWGFWGSLITLRIAAATFALHLIYGLTLGWLMDRKRIPV